MIVMRISGVEGVHCQISGGSKVEGKYRYNQSKAGWFHVSSTNFGFQSASESKKKTDKNASNNASSQAGGMMALPAISADADGKKQDQAFSTISASKSVDSVSTTLMGFAMSDRKVTKADAKKVRKADIHFLDYVKVRDGADNQFVFPYLMITLGNVLVKGWKISASGDNRPTEDIDLWYDKAAMRYFYTPDGQVWNGGEIQGWDQEAGESWTPSKGEAEYFAEDPR